VAAGRRDPEILAAIQGVFVVRITADVEGSKVSVNRA
jgi:hypothetical protein